MECLESEILIIICKLEWMFPPALFDSTEQLSINLPYKAKIIGNVQYR